RWPGLGQRPGHGRRPLAETFPGRFRPMAGVAGGSEFPGRKRFTNAASPPVSHARPFPSGPRGAPGAILLGAPATNPSRPWPTLPGSSRPWGRSGTDSRKARATPTKMALLAKLAHTETMNDTTELSVAQARDHFSDAVNRAAYAGQVTYVTRGRGRTRAAAIVPA